METPKEGALLLENPASAVVPNLFGARDWFCGRQFFHKKWEDGRGDSKWSSGGNTSEMSPTHPLLTSCCAAQFLTGHKLVPVHGLGVGDPSIRQLELSVPPSDLGEGRGAGD